MVVKGDDPRVFGGEAGGHGIADVREDAGADSCTLQVLDPVEHGGVDLAPEVGICGLEVEDLGIGEADCATVGDLLPVGGAVEGAAIIVVAVGPVFAVEGGIVEAGDGDHAGPGSGKRRAGEDHAVVE